MYNHICLHFYSSLDSVQVYYITCVFLRCYVVCLLSLTDWTIHALCQFEVYVASGWSSEISALHNQWTYCLLVFHHFKVSFFAEGLNLIRLCDLCFYEPGTIRLFYLAELFFQIDCFRPLLSPFFWYRTFYHWNSSVFWSMDPLLLTFWLVSATGLDILNSLWLKTIVKGLHFLLVTDITVEPRLL